MKIQIRRSVFETNSSSTHSLQITNESIDKLKQCICNNLPDLYEYCDEDPVPQFPQNTFIPFNYITNNVIYLKGFRLVDGVEMGNVYYIISNWMAKLQFMTMIIGYYAEYLEGYDHEKYMKMDYETHQTNYNSLITETKSYKKYEELVIQYVNSKGYNIDTAYFYLIKDELWFEEIFHSGNDPLFNFLNDCASEDNPITAEKIEHLFNIIMDDNYVISYNDEAYYPSDDPEIYII